MRSPLYPCQIDEALRAYARSSYFYPTKFDEGTMRALEDLLNEVRDIRARDHLAEAIRAYHAGALRSSIISTWVAVALDLTKKIRELSEMGDSAATAYIDSLDRAIQNKNVQTLSKLESELLFSAKDTFEFISAREFLELGRLQQDRNACAHPAFISPDVVFMPTPELCRAHLGVAVDSVLKHGPTPGRKALDRFVNELKGNSWPSDDDELAQYLRATYFARGKESLHRALAIVIVKGCLDSPDGADERLWFRMAQAVHALDTIAPSILEVALAAVITTREENSGMLDEQCLRFVGALGDITAAKEALPAESRPKMAAAVSGASLDDLIKFATTRYSINDATVALALRQRLVNIGYTSLVTLVENFPNRVLLPSALVYLAQAGSYRAGEDMMRQLILPLGDELSADDVKLVCDALRANGQVREAARVPSMVCELFERTRTLEGVFPIWKEFSEWLRSRARDGDLNDFYAYPELAMRISTAPDA